MTDLTVPHSDPHEDGGEGYAEAVPVGCLSFLFDHAGDARCPNKCVAIRLVLFEPVSANARNGSLNQQFCDAVRRVATRRNALTRTFNPKVPGSRPGRPTRSEAPGCTSPPPDIPPRPCIRREWSCDAFANSRSWPRCASTGEVHLQDTFHTHLLCAAFASVP